MKSINTLSIFITLCLTALITLFLTTANAQAAQLPKVQIEKAEVVNKNIFKAMAKQTIAQSMANLQLSIEPAEKTTLLAKQFKPLKVKNAQEITKVNTISE